MLLRRRKRWANIELTLSVRLTFTGRPTGICTAVLVEFVRRVLFISSIGIWQNKRNGLL